MHGWIKILSAILLVSLALMACGDDKNGAAVKNSPPSAAKPAAELKVSGKREVEVDGRILSLSPDGQWLSVEKRGVLCIYETSTLTERSCTEAELQSIDLQSAVWSPDSAHIAFTENFFKFFHESDLWVLEVESGALTNLTDDGEDRFSLAKKSEGNEPPIDLIPTWSPDSKTLIFSRSTRQAAGWDGTILFRIALKGGNAENLQVIDNELPAAIWPTMLWSDDGKTILYTINKSSLDDPDIGIWKADRDGKDPQHILSTTVQEMGAPMLMGVSAATGTALAWYANAAMQRGPSPNISYFVLLDLETGDVEPLKQAKGDEVEFYGLNNAIFSPDGSKILYSYRSVDDQFRLLVRDVDSDGENILITHDAPLGYSYEIGLGLAWAADDVIFAATSSNSGLLLTLGTD